MSANRPSNSGTANSGTGRDTGVSNFKTPQRKMAKLKMTLRCATALLGSYFAAAGLASLMARLLPIARAEATAWGLILSFLFYALFGLWAFFEQRLLRVTGVIWGTAVATITWAFLLGVRA
ncbi:hypothetical protein [Sphingomonas paeninsulae]|nr:hypothetical protein [Sphingomonas paeninsulae]